MRHAILALGPVALAAVSVASVPGPANADPLVIAKGQSLVYGVQVEAPFDGFINWGSVTDPGVPVVSIVDLLEFRNEAGALIQGRGESPDGSGGVGVMGDVAQFTNLGTIIAGDETGVYIDGTTGTFRNAGTITATGNYDVNHFGVGVALNLQVTDFINSGSISGNWGAVSLQHGATTFRNEATGKIFGTTESAVGIESGGGIDDFTNAGRITALADTRQGRSAVFVSGGVRSFTNSNIVESYNEFGNGVRIIDGPVVSFTNTGKIGGYHTTGNGVKISGTATTSVLNSGLITGGYAGMIYTGDIGSFVNEGTISGTGPTSGGLSFQNGVVVNRGIITGVTGGIGVDAEQAGSATIVNSGRISGGSYGITYAYLPNNGTEIARDDVLRLLPGSSITGLVEFGMGDDLLDLSQFDGTMALNVANLESLKLTDGSTQSFGAFTSQQIGSRLTARQGDKLAIVDAEVTTSASGGGAVATSAASVTTEVANVISDQLSSLGAGNGPDLNVSNVSAYAPSPNPSAGEQAVLTALDVAPERGPTVWASAFGGGARDLTGAPLTSLFGGIVAGSHTKVGQFTLGGLGGVVRSQLATGGQSIDTATGLLGGYAQTTIGIVRVDGTLLGGYNMHASARDAGAGETAAAEFGSWFLAPDLSLTVPVLTSDAGELAVAFRTKYVTGVVGGYTETGALANLTVGPQQISLLDLRLETNGSMTVDAASRTVLTAKGGVFYQSNLGGSSSTVGVLGSSFDVVTPNSRDYGVYGGAGVSTALGAAVDVSASVNGSLRNDGLASASAKAQLTGQF